MMRRQQGLVVIAIVYVVCLCTCDAFLHKISPHVLKHVEDRSTKVDVMLRLHSQADLSDVDNIHHEERGHEVVRRLKSVANNAESQAVKAVLDRLGLSYRTLWICNSFVVTGIDHTLAHTLAMLPEVSHVDLNKEFKALLPEQDEPLASIRTTRDVDAIEWNIQYVHGPEVWLQGFRGSGIVIANADTGVAWEHPALINQYRGVNGNITDHNYNWWDSMHAGSASSCGHDLQAPCDDHGHGTHTTGTAVGGGRGAHGIGMAPEARWIACRNMAGGTGSPSSYIECLQWFIAPTDLQGENPRPDLRPHIISNSYGCPPSEGCNVNSLSTALAAVRAAGIFMSVSAGNTGSNCFTITDPPATDPNVFTVAAMAFNSRAIASFSSRGVVNVDGSMRMKPNIAAPGSNVRSSYPPNRYTSMSGTSMAAPLVAGAVALLWDARADLVRNISLTEQVVQDTAVHVWDYHCMWDSYDQRNPPPQNPNWGYGEINLPAALVYQTSPPPAPSPTPSRGP